MRNLTMVMPADEPYSPRSGGAVATVGDALVRALTADGVAVQVVSPHLGAPQYPSGNVTQLRSGAHRSLTNRVVGRARRALTHRNGTDATERYRAEAREAAENQAVVVHNDARLAVALRRGGHRVILWLHNLLPEQDAEVLRAADAAGVAFVCVSGYVREWTAQAYGIDLAAMDVVHNTIDADEFRPPEAWSGAGALRVVIHGRIDPNKGQLLAARAVAAARERGARIDLTVVGAVKTFGMSRERVDAYVGELRAAVDAAGAAWDGPVQREAMPALLRRFDVALALPTVPEPFSLAALEGMASGCATVAVPLGGLAEVVGDAARLCAPDVGSVADALGELAADADDVARWRERARTRAEDFAWPGGAARIRTILDGISR